MLTAYAQRRTTRFLPIILRYWLPQLTWLHSLENSMSWLRIIREILQLLHAAICLGRFWWSVLHANFHIGTRLRMMATVIAVEPRRDSEYPTWSFNSRTPFSQAEVCLIHLSSPSEDALRTFKTAHSHCLVA